MQHGIQEKLTPVQQALHTAISKKSILEAKIAIANGAKVNVTDPSPLIAAIDSGYFEMVKFLIEEHGADINQRLCKYGTSIVTPLQVSIDSCIYITRLTQLNIQTEKSELTQNPYLILDYLLSKKGDTNNTNNLGNTALHIAAMYSDKFSMDHVEAIIGKLVNAGADIQLKNGKEVGQVTPFEYGMRYIEAHAGSNTADKIKLSERFQKALGFVEYKSTHAKLTKIPPAVEESNRGEQQETELLLQKIRDQDEIIKSLKVEVAKEKEELRRFSEDTKTLLSKIKNNKLIEEGEYNSFITRIDKLLKLDWVKEKSDLVVDLSNLKNTLTEKYSNQTTFRLS